MSELVKKRVPRMEPHLWHEKSIAAWNKFGEDNEGSRTRCKKVREAWEKQHLKSAEQSSKSNGKPKRKSRTKVEAAAV